MANAQPLIQEIIAKVSGQQELNSLISGLEAYRQSIAKTNDAAAGAVASHQRMGDEMRKSRQAYSQLGMQVNQFAGQLAGGTKFTTAFVQQIGDISYVIGQAGGAFGKFGTFLQGPWAAAILVGISVLTPLISKILDSKDAADTARSAFSDYMASLSQTSKLSDVFTENSVKIANTSGEIGKLTARLTTLKRTQQVLNGAVTGEQGASAALNAATMIASVQQQIDAKKKLIQTYKDEIATASQLAQTTALQEANKARLSGGASPRSSRSSGGDTSAVRDIKTQVDTMQSVMDDILITSVKAGNELIKSSEEIGDRIANSVSTMSNESSDYLAGLKTQMDDIIYGPGKQIVEMSQAMGTAFSDGIKGMITGAMSFKQVMSNVIQSVINELFRMYVVQQLTGFISNKLGAITGSPLPGKAIGGPVQSGQPYMVGERGPELFVPSRSGSIIPHGSTGGNISIAVDARGASDPAAVRQQVEMGIMQAAPYLLAAAEGRTLASASRVRLPGAIV